MEFGQENKAGKAPNEEVGEAEVDSIKGRTPQKSVLLCSSPTPELVERTLSRRDSSRFVHAAVHKHLSTVCKFMSTFAQHASPL